MRLGLSHVLRLLVEPQLQVGSLAQAGGFANLIRRWRSSGFERLRRALLGWDWAELAQNPSDFSAPCWLVRPAAVAGMRRVDLLLAGPTAAGSRGWRLDPLPAWLAQLIQRQRDLPVTCSELPVAPGIATAYGAAALRRELERLSGAVEGSRNHELNRASFALGTLVGSGALDEASVTDALMDAGLRLGLGERECERTIASGMGAGIAAPRVLER